jgi:Protein of unknown function (DUF2380)
MFLSPLQQSFDSVGMHARLYLLCAGLSVILPAGLRSQATLERPDAPIAVLRTALYNEQANLREPADSAKAGLGTEVLRRRLQDRIGTQVRPYHVTDSTASSAQALALTGGIPCEVKVACALAVARGQDARWVVMTKVSKTSNLIWLLSAELIRVATGEIILDDSTELKGDPDQMIRVGMRIFADRLIRTVRAGGVTTNFPMPSESPAGS